MFENTLKSVDECGIDYLHVFPYSPRPGTPAAKMPQVARDVIKARAARLREKGVERLALRLDRHVGATKLGAGGKRRARAAVGFLARSASTAMRRRRDALTSSSSSRATPAN